MSCHVKTTLCHDITTYDISWQPYWECWSGGLWPAKSCEIAAVVSPSHEISWQPYPHPLFLSSLTFTPSLSILFSTSQPSRLALHRSYTPIPSSWQGSLTSSLSWGEPGVCRNSPSTHCTVWPDRSNSSR